MINSDCIRWIGLDHGILADLSEDRFPTVIAGWKGRLLHLAEGQTHYGYVCEGSATIQCASGRFRLSEGLYFCVPGRATVHGTGKGMVISRVGYSGMFTVGGPLEERGRLRYIDGCSDSLLIGPPLVGDPCLNMLYVPPHTNQTTHMHHSLRIGIIASGSGRCETSNGPIHLMPGHVLVLRANAIHSFHTDEIPLQIVVYHPDSDMGPSHESHPMLNRTVIGRFSAAHKG